MNINFIVHKLLKILVLVLEWILYGLKMEIMLVEVLLKLKYFYKMELLK